MTATAIARSLSCILLAFGLAIAAPGIAQQYARLLRDRLGLPVYRDERVRIWRLGS